MTQKQSGPRGEKRVYQDIVRFGERVLDAQFRMALDRFDRTDRLARLGAATLAGMVVVLGFFLTQSSSVHTLGIAGIGLSIVAVILAVSILVRLNTGAHRRWFRSGTLDATVVDRSESERLVVNSWGEWN